MIILTRDFFANCIEEGEARRGNCSIATAGFTLWEGAMSKTNSSQLISSLILWNYTLNNFLRQLSSQENLWVRGIICLGNWKLLQTDTASVLHEAMRYIKFLQDQVQVLCSPYLQRLPSLPVSVERQVFFRFFFTFPISPKLRKFVCLFVDVCHLSVQSSSTSVRWWARIGLGRFWFFLTYLGPGPWGGFHTMMWLKLGHWPCDLGLNKGLCLEPWHYSITL